MNMDRFHAALLTGGAIAISLAASAASAEPQHFQRLATYPVFLNLPDGVDPTTATTAQGVAASGDGMTLLYSDPARGGIGFVDIADPADPVGDGSLDVGGNPTEIAVGGAYAYVGVDTTGGPAAMAGHVAVIDVDSRVIVGNCAVLGQPNGVAISPGGGFLAVAVDNTVTGSGGLAPLGAGTVAIFTLSAGGTPTNCDAAVSVDLSGLAGFGPVEPVPGRIDINADDYAVVTLQRNNHVVLIDLAAAAVVRHFPAGTADLDAVDTVADGIIAGTGSLRDVRREPDGAGWLGRRLIVTANEGIDGGGSRGFTVFDTRGRARFDSGELMEHLAMSIGHYLEESAEAGGVTPENVTVARYGGDTLIFVSSATGNFVAAFTFDDRLRDALERGAHDDDDFDDDDGRPVRFRLGDTLRLVDVLPTAVGPEGMLAIPQRNLFVVATDVDDEGEGIRSTLSIHSRDARERTYPAIVSRRERSTGAPIGWGALSGAVADPHRRHILYVVNDSFYDASRIYTVNTRRTPARITGFVDLTLDGILKGYDLEGIAVHPDGGFWVVSEGRIERGRRNLLLRVAADGTVLEEIGLPTAYETNFSVRFGFEGVAAWGDKAIVAIQREWADDADDEVKLAVYDPATASWSFVRYPKDPPSSPRGGWVGLSEITAIGGDRFLIIERDNQPGIYATRKVVTEISLAGVEPGPLDEVMPEPSTLPLVEKTVIVDLLPLMRATNGWISDKPESLAVSADRRMLVITDNDGVDGAAGETLLFDLGSLADLM
ncbi:MAG: alkaline phosphatase [Inquilinus sp.]|nr:alkaline phosphatase [Inquilinus sp.]